MRGEGKMRKNETERDETSTHLGAARERMRPLLVAHAAHVTRDRDELIATE